MSEENILIAIPKAAKKSFTPQRLVKANALLGNQIKHIYQLEKDIRRKLKEGIQFRDVKTEADAAAYIGKVTAILHPHLAEAAAETSAARPAKKGARAARK